MTKILSLLILTIGISGCFLTGGKVGDFTIIKPSQAQISSAAKTIVCQSFGPIRFSGKGDTPDTVRQVREHNAALRSFGCDRL